MKNGVYWKKRFKQIEESQHQQGLQCYADIEKQYLSAQRQIEAKINAWYQRFADNNEISLVEARRLLNSSELDELKWDVEQYIRYGKENAINGQWIKELENASAKVHINRLEALKLQMQQSLEVMFGNQLDSVDSAIRDVYQSGFLHTAYEIQKGIGTGWSFASPNDRLIDTVVHKPWAADEQTFSDRIWTNKQKLINELNTTLTQNIITGADPQKAINEIARKMNVSKQNAGRLVMTEQAAFSNAAQKDCFAELGVEQFEVVETLDSSTCEFCGSMDGQHFPMSQYEIGVTAPPFHPNCRGCTCPYFDDDFGVPGERAARGEDGKTYYVPADMTYHDWEKSFVDGSGKDSAKADLKEVKPDDTIKVQEKISDQNTRIDDLKQQFSEVTEGYSYDEWFSEFDSIEDGFGEVTEDDLAQVTKLKDLDAQIREAETTKHNLLLQKDRRGQLDSGYTGKVPDDELDTFNAKAFEQIKVDTGYSDEDAKTLHESLMQYFGGDYETILTGGGDTAKIISDGIDRMPVYDGTVYRGLSFSEWSDGDISQFTGLKPGDRVPSKGIISSWSDEKIVAEAFGGASTQSAESSTVIFECVNNQTGVGVQHLSKFGTKEAEVLSNAEYEVLEVITQSKYDYVSGRKDLQYFPDDLITEEVELKKQVVCVIKVKEV
jgi:SPP1 gp7 family putative phage head morphogenesis protein